MSSTASSACSPWTPARDEADFWARLEAGSRALVAHLRAHPDDLALADAAVGRARGGVWLGWFGAVVEDGRRLGFIRTDVDPDLLAGATAAVMRAADAWALHALNAAPPERPTARPVLPGANRSGACSAGCGAAERTEGPGVRTDLEIRWEIPPTSPGPLGRLERFMGPGKSHSESAVELLGAGGCAVLLAAGVWSSGIHRDWSGPSGPWWC